MTYALGAKSESRLAGVHPSLARVVRRAIQITKQDFMVVEGVRTREQMMVNYGKGRTPAECVACGVPAPYAAPAAAKVTWLRNPFNSNHRVMPDGYGHAVDLGAWVDGAYDGNTSARYDQIALAMLQAAHLEGVHIRWGADWDGDGKWHEPAETDMAHFELVD